MPEDIEVPEDEVFVPPAVVDPTSTDPSVEPSSAPTGEPTGTDDEEVVLPEFDPRYRTAVRGPSLHREGQSDVQVVGSYVRHPYTTD